MTAARIRAQFPTSDGFGYQLKGCCRPPFVWASYNISRYIGRHSSRENNVPYCSHYSSSNTVQSLWSTFHVSPTFTVERAAPAVGVVFCSQINLSAPVLSRLFNARGKAPHREAVPRPSPEQPPRVRRPRGQQSQGSRNESSQGPPHPTLRANPFPEVTDLLCRLPLSTLLYRPEAAHLGDLMRLLDYIGSCIPYLILIINWLRL